MHFKLLFINYKRALFHVTLILLIFKDSYCENETYANIYNGDDAKESNLSLFLSTETSVEGSDLLLSGLTTKSAAAATTVETAGNFNNDGNSSKRNLNVRRSLKVSNLKKYNTKQKTTNKNYLFINDN